jgi:hypothetical protein
MHCAPDTPLLQCFWWAPVLIEAALFVACSAPLHTQERRQNDGVPRDIGIQALHALSSAG